MSLYPAPAPVQAAVPDPSETLLDAFSRLVDPRQARGIRHPLPAVLALCVVALLSGRQNLTQIWRFGKDHPEVLDALGFRRRRPPVTTTISTLLGALRISELQDALAEWLCDLFRSARSQRRNAAAAVDGKTTRPSKVHVLNVFVLDLHQAIWQSAVDEKANEITALREAVATLFERYP
ncbi:transposase family protein, partial [bacterium]|nr:transposase family protein [bacterium]